MTWREDVAVDAYLERLIGLIADKGWAVQAVGSADPAESYCYTVGLAYAGLPELWLGTLAPQQAGGVLNAIADQAVAGRLRLEPGVVDVGYSTPFRLHGPVDVDAAQVFVATRLQADVPVRVVQVLWPDEAGRFPGDTGYDSAAFPQRLLPLAQA